ncbi:MAG: polysaccharide biosynthesis C-terminal domain-containing protein [Thermoleophilaceae bacterium]
MAAGALTQQAAQVLGLAVLLVIFTVLARRLSLAELGAYGLMATLAGYLLVLKNSVAPAAVRVMVAAPTDALRAGAFLTAAALYAVVGIATGLLIALAGTAISFALLDGGLAHEARLGALVLGAVTAVGLALSVNLDALRAAMRLTRSAANEIAALALFAALMLGLIAVGADLWLLIGASGSIPLLSGTINLVARRRLGLAFRLRRRSVTRGQASAVLPTAGWLLVAELSNLVIYGLDRIVLGAFTGPRTIGVYEGPLRAHNVLLAMSQALGVTALPAATRVAGEHESAGEGEGDGEGTAGGRSPDRLRELAGEGAAGGRSHDRLGELAVRGSRYSLALFVPLTVTAMVLGAPALEVWLGEQFRAGATPLALLVSYWLLYGALAVNPAFLVGAGQARRVALTAACVAGANLVLSIALTPLLGLEGPALATAIAYLAAFPAFLAITRSVVPGAVGALARQAWLPAYSLGAALALALIGARAALPLERPGLLIVALLLGPALYWLAYWRLWLAPGERRLVRDVGRGLLPGRRSRGA